MRLFHYITLFLTIAGALNWGLVGLFNFNLIHSLFGAYPMLERIIYTLFGASGLGLGATFRDQCAMYKQRYVEYPDKHERRVEEKTTSI
jgi:uncharacterized membrane protein YuzA (DUF378 family)